MATVLIVIILLVIFSPWIKKWIMRFLMNRAEDFVRSQVGAPSRKEEKRARRNEEKRTKYRYSSTRHRPSHIPFPKEYAEDVEFTEYKEFSQTVITGTPGKTKFKQSSFSKTTVIESQIEDVEFIELK